MAHVLYAVANATGDDAKLHSVPNPGDDTAIPGLGVHHTGGTDNNWIYIPDCSDSRYYNDHHIEVRAANWVIVFWADDDNGRQFYWNNTDNFTTAHPAAGSKNVDDCALMIRKDDKGQVEVVWQPW